MSEQALEQYRELARKILSDSPTAEELSGPRDYLVERIAAAFVNYQCTCANNPKNSWPNLLLQREIEELRALSAEWHEQAKLALYPPCGCEKPFMFCANKLDAIIRKWHQRGEAEQESGKSK